jgi:hypothetical protein
MLDRLFGRKTSSDRHHTQPDASEAIDCPHGALTPRWDSIDDMGHEDRASSFVCDSCHQSLTPAEAQQARHTAADRLRRE